MPSQQCFVSHQVLSRWGNGVVKAEIALKSHYIGALLLLDKKKTNIITLLCYKELKFIN